MIELVAANQNVTRLRRLERRRNAREDEGVIVVEAVKVIAEALRARRVESIFVRGGNHPTSESIEGLLGPVDLAIPIYVLDPKTFD